MPGVLYIDDIVCVLRQRIKNQKKITLETSFPKNNKKMTKCDVILRSYLSFFFVVICLHKDVSGSRMYLL